MGRGALHEKTLMPFALNVLSVLPLVPVLGGVGHRAHCTQTAMRVPQRNHHAVPTSFPNILQCRATQRMFMRSQGVPNEPNRMAQHAIVRGG